MRPACALLLASLLPAQTQPVFRAPVRIVEAPVAVTDENGKPIRGLHAGDFTLFDNERPQHPEVDESGSSFAVAIAVQTSESVRAWLPEVSRSSSALEALLIGAKGTAAVLTFSDEVTLNQPLTDSIALLDKAFRALKPQGERSRCVDAVLTAAHLLADAPPEARRVLLLIAQAGDAGSKANLRAAIAEIERRNIVVYALEMPRVGKDLLGNIRVSGLSSADGRDTGFIVSADLTKLIPEIYRGQKAAAGEDAVHVLTRYTGGKTIPFRKRADLDAAISAIGEELHTGYVLSYTPTDKSAGYHKIRVEAARSGAQTRARPGYFNEP